MRIYTIFKNIIKKIKANVNVERITEEQIDDMFGSASGTGTNAQDYVIEHVNNPSSGYTKWASGKLEVWKRVSPCVVNITSPMSGGMYYGTISAIEYPITFSTYPTVNITAQVTGGYGWLIPTYDNYSTSNTGTLYVYYVESKSNVNTTINIYAVGKWK